MIRRILPALGMIVVGMALAAGHSLHPTAAQTDEPDPQVLIETAISQANAATDINAVFSTTFNTTERVMQGAIFREQRTSQTENGTSAFVADQDGNATYSFYILINHDARRDSSSASTVASYQAEWSVRIINGRMFSQAAYISGGSDFPSLESGWRIVTQPNRYPLQSSINFGRVRDQLRPDLGLPDLLTMLDSATEITFLPDADDPTVTTLRITFTNADAATYLDHTLLQSSAAQSSNPVLAAIVNDVRSNPANTTRLLETLRFDTNGHLIGRESTYNIAVSELPIGDVLTDADPDLRLNFNQTVVRDHTYTYNTGIAPFVAPDLAVTPVPFEDTFSE